MALRTGTQLGPYEILSPIGAGGMGEVYRARDTRLERTDAVKILRDHLSDRAEVRERFERGPLRNPAPLPAAGQHPGADGGKWLALGAVDRSAARVEDAVLTSLYPERHRRW
jgi:hypothetical protein